MLSDEEKKAIAKVKDVIEYDKEHRIVTIYDKQPLFRDTLQTTLNLIEKQSKEIEELKDTRSIFNMGRRSYKNEIEYKIKAKIEEYDDKGMTINLTNRSAGKTFQQAVHYEVKKVLQSLLEKE